jgi:hypothetical protein
MESVMSDPIIDSVRSFVAGLVVAIAAVSGVDAGESRPKNEECPPTRQTDLALEAVSDLVRRNEDIVLGTVISRRPSSSGEWRGANRVFRVSVLGVLKGDERVREFDLAGLEPDNLYPIDPYVLAAHSMHATIKEAKHSSMPHNYSEYPPFGATTRYKLASAKGKQDCDYAPVLEVGMTYLMFLSRPYSHLSFEPIVYLGGDVWFEHVQALAARQKTIEIEPPVKPR